MDAPSDPIDSCIFCKILRGDVPSTVIKEWEDAICVIPLDACAPGHVLVLPKTHVKNGEEDKNVTAKTIACAMDNPRELMTKAMQHLQEPLPKNSDFDYNTQFSKGKDATQTVFHLHIHLVPRFPNDGLTLPWTGQDSGHYNTTGKPKIQPSKCQGVPEEKKGVCCRRKQMMRKEEQQRLRRQLRA
jgi:histidine triad (HIT) family protein